MVSLNHTWVTKHVLQAWGNIIIIISATNNIYASLDEFCQLRITVLESTTLSFYCLYVSKLWQLLHFVVVMFDFILMPNIASL